MTSDEAGRIVDLAKKWFGTPNRPSEILELGAQTAEPTTLTSGSSDPPNLLRTSKEVHELLIAQPPLSETLQRARGLFDAIADAPGRSDVFGEKHEICFLLCFVAWRHASGLGLEAEAQEWLRTAELVAFGRFAASDSLESFLFLEESRKTPSLFFSFLGNGFDLFLAVAILRRERLASPMRVVAITIAIYRWMSEFRPNLPTAEREFFLGEFAFLTAAIYRPLGRRREYALWLAIARKHFRLAPANRPLRLKALALRLIASRDAHGAVERRLARISHLLLKYGMYHEELSCRLAIALIDKIFGRNIEALAALRSISGECQNSSEQGILAAALSNIAEIHCLQGEHEKANLDLVEALAATELTSDPAVSASVWSCVGAVNLHRRQFSAAISALHRSLDYLIAAGCSSWLAYARVILAEALIEAGRFRSAFEQLVLAIPVLRHENMVPEGIHALKLLGVLAAGYAEGRERIRTMICEMQAELGVADHRALVR